MAILFAVQHLARFRQEKVIIEAIAAPVLCADPTIQNRVASNPQNVTPGQCSTGSTPYRHLAKDNELIVIDPSVPTGEDYCPLPGSVLATLAK